MDVKLEPYDRLVRTLLLHFQMPAPVPDSPALHSHSSIVGILPGLRGGC